MIRTFFRNLTLALALLFFLSAALALGLDALRFSSGTLSGLTPMGEFWSKLDPDSMEFVRGLIAPPVWDHIGVWLMLQPALAVLSFMGFFFLALRPVQTRKSSRFR